MNDIVILGATGSIGQIALECLNSLRKFRLKAITFNSDLVTAEKIVASFPSLEAVGIFNPEAAKAFQTKFPTLKVWAGVEANLQVLNSFKGAFVVNALAGTAGILPSFKAIENGSELALANKETLVAGGDFFLRQSAKSQAKIYPIDSEHSALYKLLRKERSADIRNLIITASGGSVRNVPFSSLPFLTPAEVLNHPTWSMGPKITVDSATMANKAFEVIEAHILFGYDVERIRVLLHDESLIHAGLEMVDGSIVFEAGPNDMRVPIIYALNRMHRHQVSSISPLDLEKSGRLNFRELEHERYPLFSYILEASQKGGTSPAAIIAADEEAVKAFLDGRIGFTEIFTVVRTVFNRCRIDSIESTDDIFYALKQAQVEARTVISELERI